MVPCIQNFGMCQGADASIHLSPICNETNLVVWFGPRQPKTNNENCPHTPPLAVPTPVHKFEDKLERNLRD